MKYGEQFEKESVPEWSLYNIDYNALKHHIKVYTTRDQAAAITIPGHQDTALAKFEDELFLELARQHDRVDLFVASKADELSRRLDYLSNQVSRLISRCASSKNKTASLKRQRRFAKCQRDLETCGDEIQALARFVSAQVVAFRKILKKYRKWTGSGALGGRFKDTVLTHPKSFTRKDLSPLQSRCDGLLVQLQAAAPEQVARDASPSRIDSGERQEPVTGSLESESQSPSETRDFGTGSSRYWNEYDDGSEAGDLESGDAGGQGDYAIYIDPREDAGFPGMATLVAMFRIPMSKAKAWIAARRPGSSQSTTEQGSLLPTTNNANGYGSIRRPTTASPQIGSLTDTDVDGDSSSSTAGTPPDRTNPHPLTSLFRPLRRSEDDWRRGRLSSSPSSSTTSLLFPTGYAAHYAERPSASAAYALPSLAEQRARRARDRQLMWATWAAFAAAAVLLLVASLLAATGRHRLRAEVDAGVTLGAAGSLACACAALGTSLTRRPGAVGWVQGLAIWAAFAATCVLNGGLLVVVVGRAGTLNAAEGPDSPVTIFGMG